PGHLLLPLLSSSTSSLSHVFLFFLFYFSRSHLVLLSFPTRRSSDLGGALQCTFPRACACASCRSRRWRQWYRRGLSHSRTSRGADRKSTRLNSSHVAISYAVFCLKKKKKRKE